MSTTKVKKSTVRVSTNPDFNKKPSKKTHEAIQFFKGNRKAVDMLEQEDGRKKLKLSPAAGRVEKKLINFTVNHETIVLVFMVVVLSAIAIWFIKQ